MNPTPLDFLLLFFVLMGGAWGLIVGAVKVSGPFALVLALLSLAHAYPGVSARFGTDPGVQFFLVLLLIFIGLIIYSFVARILHGAVHASGLGPLNRLLGVGLGLVTGTVLAGAVLWGLETYGGIQGKLLLHGSVLAPAVTEFFQTVMAFTERLFPRPEPETKPWWRRPLW